MVYGDGYITIFSSPGVIVQGTNELVRSDVEDILCPLGFPLCICYPGDTHCFYTLRCYKLYIQNFCKSLLKGTLKDVICKILKS